MANETATPGRERGAGRMGSIFHEIRVATKNAAGFLGGNRLKKIRTLRPGTQALGGGGSR